MHFTRREQDVLDLLRIDPTMTSRAIAAALFLSPRTVENYVSRVMTKLGVTKRADIATWATHHTDHETPTE